MLYYTLGEEAKELYNNKFFDRPQVFAEARRFSSKLDQPIRIFVWNGNIKALVATVNPDGSFLVSTKYDGRKVVGAMALLSAVAQRLEDSGKTELAKEAENLIIL